MKPDVVLVFAFGSQGTAPNAGLSHKAEVFGKMGIPVFSQWDVPVDNGTVFFAEDILRMKGEWQKGRRIATLDVVRAFEYIAWDKGWRRVLILAAPQHLKRCLRDARKRLLHPQITRVEGYHWRTLERFWYDPLSAQWYTRGPLRWWLREMFLRLLPWGLYVRLAKGKFG